MKLGKQGMSKSKISEIDEVFPRFAKVPILNWGFKLWRSFDGNWVFVQLKLNLNNYYKFKILLGLQISQLARQAIGGPHS